MMVNYRLITVPLSLTQNLNRLYNILMPVTTISDLITMIILSITLFDKIYYLYYLN